MQDRCESLRSPTQRGSKGSDNFVKLRITGSGGYIFTILV
jgi:hypothetical protein